MGAWQIPVAGIVATVNPPLPIGQTLSSGPVSLLVNDAPTLMVDWLIDAIYVPCAIFTKITPVVPASVVTQVTMTLRSNGQVLWAQQLEAVMQGETEESSLKGANVVFNADLVNPIILKRGRTLTIEVAATFSAALNTNRIELGATIPVPSGGSTSTIRSEGFVGYQTRALTGHRTL